MVHVADKNSFFNTGWILETAFVIEIESFNSN